MDGIIHRESEAVFVALGGSLECIVQFYRLAITLRINELQDFAIMLKRACRLSESGELEFEPVAAAEDMGEVYATGDGYYFVRIFYYGLILCPGKLLMLTDLFAGADNEIRKAERILDAEGVTVEPDIAEMLERIAGEAFGNNKAPGGQDSPGA
jgi:hypothetical protein